MEQAIIGDLDVCGGLCRIGMRGGLTEVLRAVTAAGVTPEAVDLLSDGTVLLGVAAADAPAIAHLPGAGRPEPAVRVVLTGAGLRGDPALVPTFCEVLCRAGAVPMSVSAESGRIGAVVGADVVPRVIAGLREAFELSPASVFADSAV
ncbi:hypothetical protein AB0M48_21955 [Lentzea sp. NPDC051208]|uniref:hypothetical protein n=1 Tax=Lentzea sp. NPDC051208 TaxID=3154642 RepID=UPI00341D5480